MSPTTSTPLRPALVGLVRLEVASMAVDRRFLLLSMVVPAAMYLLFATLPGDGLAADGLPAAVAEMVSMAAYGAIGSALSVTAPRVAQERGNGWLRQLRVLPVAAADVVGAKVVAAMAWALPAVSSVLVVAGGSHHLSLQPWTWVGLALVLWLATAPFAALGLFVGQLCDDSSAFAVMYGTYLFLGAGGGLWMPVSVLPGPLRAVSSTLPSTRMAELGRSVAAGAQPSLTGVLVLVGWTLVLAAGCSVVYRRQRRMP